VLHPGMLLPLHAFEERGGVGGLRRQHLADHGNGKLVLCDCVLPCVLECLI
jgi:hypothetical protein